MTRKAEDIRARADQFAARAAAAKQRTVRNTFLSVEQSLRALADEQDEGEAPAGAEAKPDRAA